MSKINNLYEHNYNELFQKYEEKLNNEIDGYEYELIKVFSNKGRTMLDLIHKDCNKHYIVEQNKFFSGHNRCQNKDCKFKRRSKQKLKSIDLVKNEIKNLVGDEYLLLDEHYSGTNKNMCFKHNVQECGYEFLMTPHNFIQGNQRCPKCGQISREEKYRLSQEEVKNRLLSKWGNDYEILSKYKNSKTPMNVLHKTCGHISPVSLNLILDRVCICNYCDQPTRGEKKIIDYLDTFMFGEYEYQKYYDNLLGINNGNLSYDFYLPEYNLLIEYQGEYHDGSVSCQTLEQFEVQKEHDRRKRQFAKDNNIELLEIWYWDFDNIEEIIKLKLNELKLNAKYVKILPKYRCA